MAEQPCTWRIAAAVLAAAVATGALTGCRAEPSSSGAGGVVADRSTRKVWISRPKPGRWERRYQITVREDGGKRDTGVVSQKVYERCQIGDRWPDCKKHRSEVPS